MLDSIIKFFKLITGKSLFSLDMDDKDEDEIKMVKPESKFKQYLRESVKDDNGVVSSGRIQSYMMLSLIYIFCIVYLLIEIINAAISWYHQVSYEVSTQSVVIFSMILAHHLGILFHKIRENKFKK